MRIIVLGASGQIGTVIYDGLRKHHDVIGTSRKSSEKYFQFNPFNDNWSLLGKADVVINCIGQIEASSAMTFHRIHVDLIQHIIDNRALLGNPRILQISALGASSTHPVDFLRTKRIADDLLLQQSNTAVVRPSIVCTHCTMMVKKMIMLSNIAKYTLGILIVPKKLLKTRIQPVMPADLIDIVGAMCTNTEVRVVNVVGPEAMSLHDILMLLFKIRNQKLQVLAMPRMLIDMVVLNIVARFFPSVINASQYKLLFDDNTADCQIGEQLLQRSLQSTTEFFRNEFAHADH